MSRLLRLLHDGWRCNAARHRVIRVRRVSFLFGDGDGDSGVGVGVGVGVSGVDGVGVGVVGDVGGSAGVSGGVVFCAREQYGLARPMVIIPQVFGHVGVGSSTSECLPNDELL